MAREEYGELIGYVTYRVGTSKNRTWQVLKEYSDVLKKAIKRGNTIDVEGLVEITFTTTHGYIYKNSVFGLEEQIKAITDELNLDEYEVRNIVQTYLKRIKTRLEDGYQVNIKGVCYLIPVEDEGAVFCETRVSPVLEKPELADFLITTESGLVFRELEEGDLRFKVDAKEDVELLFTVATEKEKKLSLKEIDI